MKDKIDAVVLWVDGSDPKFILDKQTITGKIDASDHYSDGDMRYRDYGTLNYWFRMIENHAPWINQIFLITNGQKPDWVNLNHPKLKLVTHKEFMPRDYLPTFNSAAIELNLHRIAELSENFLYFNDDMYMIRDCSPSDFFKHNQPKLFAVYDAIVPWSPITKTYLNNIELIYRHFPNKVAMKSSPFKFFNYRYGVRMFKNLLLLPWGPTGYVNLHLPVPMKKSTLAYLWKIEFETLDRTSRNQFRDYKVDVNQYICQNWQIESNQFYPIKYNIGKSIDLNRLDQLDGIFKDKHKKLICVNDNVEFREENILRFKQMLVDRYPEKSAFEL